MNKLQFHKLIREEIRKVLKESTGLVDFDFNGLKSFLKKAGVQSKELYNVNNYEPGRYGKRPSIDVEGGESLLRDFERLKSLPPEEQRQLLQYFKGPEKLDSFEREYGGLQVAILPDRNKKTYNFWITSETHMIVGSAGLRRGFQEFIMKWIKKSKL